MQERRMATILIVEDDFLVLFMAESNLRVAGYETIVAGTRKEALTILRSNPKIDVLFTDVKLRRENRAGMELAQRAVELKPNLGVLYTTGGDVPSAMVEGSEFLPKPYTSNQLTHAVADLLEAALALPESRRGSL
jgi:DNA-binding NtrC family response regulator